MTNKTTDEKLADFQDHIKRLRENQTELIAFFEDMLERCKRGEIRYVGIATVGDGDGGMSRIASTIHGISTNAEAQEAIGTLSAQFMDAILSGNYDDGSSVSDGKVLN